MDLATLTPKLDQTLLCRITVIVTNTLHCLTHSYLSCLCMSTLSSLVKALPCNPYVIKPLPEPIMSMTNYQSEPETYISMKHSLKFKQFHYRKMDLKMLFARCPPFHQGFHVWLKPSANHSSCIYNAVWPLKLLSQKLTVMKSTITQHFSRDRAVWEKIKPRSLNSSMTIKPATDITTLPAGNPIGQADSMILTH